MSDPFFSSSRGLHSQSTSSANKCCRKVEPSVNSLGNKFSILHILQMESSRPDGNNASLLLIFISVRADISFVFNRKSLHDFHF